MYTTGAYVPVFRILEFGRAGDRSKFLLGTTDPVLGAERVSVMFILWAIPG